MSSRILSYSINPPVTGLLILICLSFFFINQNILAEGSSDCQGTIQDIEDGDDYDDDDDDYSGWAIVTKRLCNTHALPEWSINSGNIAFSSKQFCIIAYDGLHIAEAGNCIKEREMKKPGVKLGETKDGSGDHFYLTAGNEQLPVKIALKRVDGANSYPLSPGVETILQKADDKCTCSRNEYTLDISVKSNDVLNSQISGRQFTGEFTLKVWNSQKTKYSIEPQVLRIILDITPAIRISGLQDMTLAASNGSAHGSRPFCVFAVGTATFSLLPDSLNGQSIWGGVKKDFRLNSAGNTLNYQITLSDGFIDMSPIGSVWPGQPTTGWTPSKSPDCLSGNNMTIAVDVADTSGPAGVYTDTMTLTVAPE
ncbi:hypothetical protein [Endozoicomonas sp.]|uniref:hypothetical protein n=1 Tax=Endozoicomonas sp. TaxID=1892382 RepID=UPI003839D4E0